MDTAAMALLLIFTVSQLLPPASCSPSSKNKYYCDWCARHSTASLLPPSAAGGDDCGYGAAMAMELNGGHVAAAGAEFFRDGPGCGACCYQLRCRDRRVCGDGGVKVVVAGAAANRTGFVLAREAFDAMARPGMADQLAAALDDDDNVQVDLRRIPCEYKQNLTVRVEEGSRNHPSGQLGIRFLYQGGQTDIAAVEIAGASSWWRPMERLRRRSRAAVWRTPCAAAAAGPLRLRLVVTAGVGGKWLRTRDGVLPADWRPGQAYDTGLRVTDVALRTCARSCPSGGGGGGGGEELRR